jgi:1-acyl-sn-glycerol-3-phosphate acyltransferase
MLCLKGRERGKNYGEEETGLGRQRQVLCYMFIYLQLVFQTGYEVHGMEKIPEGAALIIFYHGAIPIDFYYFMAKIFIQKGRTCRVVADHFVFKIPGKT